MSMEMYNKRESGIELIKIIAILFIVISHVTQSLGNINCELSEYANSIVNLEMASANMQHFLLVVFRYLGTLGNNIFFICLFWFFVDSKETKIKKIITILMDTWLISIIFLTVYIIAGEGISIKEVIVCIFPTIFSNNWFITCYILIYGVHSFLNIIINQISQKSYLLFLLVSFVIYSGFAFAESGLFFSSDIIIAINLYFLIGYLKKYKSEWCNSLKINIIISIVGFLGVVGLLFATNLLGLYYSIFNDQLMRWCTNNNPFVIMLAVGLFNIFRNLRFKNRIINYLSSLSLFIYVIHENLLFRKYTRVAIWVSLVNYYGCDNIVVVLLIYAVVLFIAACVVSALYQNTIHRVVNRIEKFIEKLVVGVFNKITGKMIVDK